MAKSRNNGYRSRPTACRIVTAMGISLTVLRTNPDRLMAVSGEGKSVLSEPSGAARASLGGGISVALAQSARRLAGGSLATKLAMLLLGFADPLDARISADSSVRGIDHDDLVIFVGRVLADPV